MAKTAVRTDVDEPLDIHRHFAPQYTLHPVLRLDDSSQLGDVLIGERMHASVGIHSAFLQYGPGGRETNSIDICQTYFNPLVSGQIDAC